jgi:hypothetical protein
MDTKVLTAHVPRPLADKVDELAADSLETDTPLPPPL